MSMTNVRETEMVRQPAKKLRNVILAFRVAADMKKALEQAAINDNRSVSGLIISILDDWLKSRKYLK